MNSLILDNRNSPYIDLIFPLSGESLPLDNGYLVYAALSKICPIIHDLEHISILPIAGIPKPPKFIKLTNRSKLIIRLPVDQVPLVYSLGGQSFTIGKHRYQLGFPEPKALHPASTLYSRLVIIRGYQEPQAFLRKAQRLLVEKLGVRGNMTFLTRSNGEPQCREHTIKNKSGVFRLKGFGLKVSNLSDEDSIALQQFGIGGKHKMMVGVFVPARSNRKEQE
jgi:CRISPR-associated endonuclease/helicase Cas3